MVGLEERALRNDDLGLAELRLVEVRAKLGITGVGDQRDLELPRDLHALALELAQALLGEAEVLFPQLAAPLDDGVGEAGDRPRPYSRYWTRRPFKIW